jgi:hypothetical protein
LSQDAEPPSLLVRLTRLSDDRLRFEYRRPDGTGEAFDLDADSFLFHDLLHFAVETEANLQGSFFGLLAKVGGYAELSVAGGAALGGEIAVTERVVGALTSALKTVDLDANAFAEQAIGYLDAYDERAPSWFTAAFVLQVRERMRQLESQWRAMRFDETMELRFPLAR